MQSPNKNRSCGWSQPQSPSVYCTVLYHTVLYCQTCHRRQIHVLCVRSVQPGWRSRGTISGSEVLFLGPVVLLFLVQFSLSSPAVWTQLWLDWSLKHDSYRLVIQPILSQHHRHMYSINMRGRECSIHHPNMELWAKRLIYVAIESELKVNHLSLHTMKCDLCILPITKATRGPAQGSGEQCVGSTILSAPQRQNGGLEPKTFLHHPATTGQI